VPARETTVKIEEYIRYFHQALTAISKIQSIEERSVPALQQILYFCCLDTWAGDAFPGQKNRCRFVRFLDEIVKRDYKDRVSAFLLKVDLEEDNLVSTPLYGQITDHLSKFADMQSITADDDPLQRDLKPAGQKESQLLVQHRYDHLLWTYRNSLLHKFEIPGKAVDVKHLKIPYYISTNASNLEDVCEDNGTSQFTRELVLSNPFFRCLCESALKAFKVWLTNNGRDPYRNAELRTSWREKRRRAAP
jgi:hypothetical protein